MKQNFSSTLGSSIGFHIYRTANLFRRELTRALADHSISPEQWQILITLFESGLPLSQSRIAELTLKDRHSISRMVEKLERDILIERETDPKDLRAFRVTLTSKGKKLTPKLKEKLVTHFKPILESISSTDKEFLIRILSGLIDFMENK